MGEAKCTSCHQNLLQFASSTGISLLHTPGCVQREQEKEEQSTVTAAPLLPLDYCHPSSEPPADLATIFDTSFLLAIVKFWWMLRSLEQNKSSFIAHGTPPPLVTTGPCCQPRSNSGLRQINWNLCASVSSHRRRDDNITSSQCNCENPKGDNSIQVTKLVFPKGTPRIGPFWALPLCSLLSFPTAWWRCDDYYSYFADEETGTQDSWGAFSGSQSKSQKMRGINRSRFYPRDWQDGPPTRSRPPPFFV